jgi:hypothetical protein
MKTFFFKKILLLEILAVILAAVSIFFVFNYLKKMNQSSSIFDNKLEQVRNDVTHASSVKRNLNNNAADISKINDSVLSADEDVHFIESLEAIAAKYGLKMKINSLSFDDNPAIKSENLTFFVIKGTTSGSWNGIYYFLAALEALPVKTRIDNFSMQTVSDGPDVSNYIWQASFEFVVLKEK